MIHLHFTTLWLPLFHGSAILTTEILVPCKVKNILGMSCKLGWMQACAPVSSRTFFPLVAARAVMIGKVYTCRKHILQKHKGLNWVLVLNIFERPSFVCTWRSFQFLSLTYLFPIWVPLTFEWWISSSHKSWINKRKIRRHIVGRILTSLSKRHMILFASIEGYCSTILLILVLKLPMSYEVAFLYWQSKFYLMYASFQWMKWVHRNPHMSSLF